MTSNENWGSGFVVSKRHCSNCGSVNCSRSWDSKLIKARVSGSWPAVAGNRLDGQVIINRCDS